MKTTFSVFIAIIVYSSIYSQVRLDSIIQINEDTDQVIESFSFKYEEGKLSEWNDIKREISSSIIYNNDGQISTWNLTLDDGSLASKSFEYTSEGNLPHYTNLFYGDYFTTQYSHSNDTLTKIIFSATLNGEQFPYLQRNYSYGNGTKIIEEIDITDGNFDLVSSEETQYDLQNRITQIIYRNSNNTISLIDSFTYNEEGNIKEFYKLNYTGGVFQNKTVFSIYESNPILSFDNILNPSELFKIIDRDQNIYDLYDLSQRKYYEFLNPMLYANQVNTCQRNVNGDNINCKWYYSGSVGTVERVVTTPISIYPNPTSDKIQIQSSEHMIKYYIYDYTGTLLFEGIPKINNQIDVHELPSGTFTVICSSENEKYFFSQFVKH